MFRRDASARALLEGDALTRAMTGVGMLFAATAQPDPNIEDTALAASEEGLIRDDLRVLGVLVGWLDVYSPWLNADRLTRLVRASREVRVRAFWAAFAQRHRTDRRFSRLLQSPEPRVDLLRVGSEFQVRRRGEDERFAATVLRVPAGVLRQRAADVLAPGDLAQRHRAFRWRVVLGPSYRADMWAALEAEPGLSAAELARRTYGSFATAWTVKRDQTIVSSGRSLPVLARSSLGSGKRLSPRPPPHLRGEGEPAAEIDGNSPSPLLLPLVREDGEGVGG